MTLCGHQIATHVHVVFDGTGVCNQGETYHTAPFLTGPQHQYFRLHRCASHVIQALK